MALPAQLVVVIVVVRFENKVNSYSYQLKLGQVCKFGVEFDNKSIQDYRISFNTMKYHTYHRIQSNTIKDRTKPYKTIQYHIKLCKTVQDHAG